MAKTPAVQKPGAVVPWAARLAEEAAAAAAGEVALSEFVSFRGGILVFNGQQVEGNEKDVIILDSAYEHAWYGQKEGDGFVAWPFDTDNPRSPNCYAMGRVESELFPIQEGENAVQEAVGSEEGKCDLCPLNQWGSDLDGGKGKACKNVRRLALMDADYLNGGPEAVDKAPAVFAKLPVTSGKLFSAFVLQTANVIKRPPYGIIAKMSVVPDPRTQFQVRWSFVEVVPDALVPVIMAKRDRMGDAIMFSYPPNEEATTQAQPVRPAARAAAPAAKAAPAKPAPQAPQAPKKPQAKSKY